jgi:hypothetical protein
MAAIPHAILLRFVIPALFVVVPLRLLPFELTMIN